jgi:hypothetical protein
VGAADGAARAGVLDNDEAAMEDTRMQRKTAELVLGIIMFLIVLRMVFPELLPFVLSYSRDTLAICFSIFFVGRILASIHA